MAIYFNKTIEKISVLVASIKNEADVMDNLASNLSGNMNETTDAVQAIDENVILIKNQITTQKTDMQQTSDMVKRISENLDMLNSNIATQMIGTNTMWYAIGVSEILGNLSPKPKSNINGLPNGLFYVFTDNMSTIQNIRSVSTDSTEPATLMFPREQLRSLARNMMS